MGKILRDIYSDISISSKLGFKGGTCAYFFYNLTRFSVDLDFDLLDPTEANQQLVFTKVEKIVEKYGIVKDKATKYFTIFFLLSYGQEDRNIKVEINTRPADVNPREHYEMKDFLGVPVLVAKPEYAFANKLVALTERREMAPRDIYDIYFFAKNNWSFDKEAIERRVKKTTPEHLRDCIDLISNVKDSEIMRGLGELVNEKEKTWVKTNLRAETIFFLKNYLAAITRQ